MESSAVSQGMDTGASDVSHAVAAAACADLSYLILMIVRMCRSFEAFIDAVASVNCGQSAVADHRKALASIETTYRTTAILEAGRISLDSKRSVEICYDGLQHCQPTRLVVI